MAFQAEEVDELDIVWPPANCYQIDILVDESTAEKFKCGICGGLCRNAVGMVCDAHDDDESAQNKVYGKQCVDDHLSKNGNKCPIGGHPNPSYVKIRFVTMAIEKLFAKCPRSALTSKNASFRIFFPLSSNARPVFLRGTRAIHSNLNSFVPPQNTKTNIKPKPMRMDR